jgi:microcystin-dependent protein
MALPFYNWSRTAASNATADSTVNWAEGQAPSSVNDSARAMMASTAAFRDDIAGAIVTGGSSTAYTVTSYQIFDTLAHMNGAMIAFTPHTANGATVTLNVDGLGAKPLRPSTGVELQSNVLIAGTPYMATYNNSDAVWYLHGLGGNTYGVPLGAGMDFWLSTAPSSAFAFPTGQAISRTTYATLFAGMGTTHGVGDGSTTFNLPDKTGRVSAMKESSATRLTSTYFVGDSTAIGAVGGSESHTLTASQSAVLAYTVTQSVAGQQHYPPVINSVPQGSGSTNVTWIGNPTTNGLAVQPTYTASSNAGGNPHKNVQPTIVCNYIMRII